MKNAEPSIYYIEKLTGYSWLRHILPYFLKKTRTANQPSNLLYYGDSSRLGLMLAHLRIGNIEFQLKPFNFSMFNIRDENGDLIWWKIEFEDSIAIQKFIRNHPEFQRILKGHETNNKIPLFLMHCIMSFDLRGGDPFLLSKILFLIHVVSLQHSDKGRLPVNMFLSSSRRPWLAEVGKWIGKESLNIIPVGELNFNLKQFILRSDSIKHLLKQLKYCKMTIKYKWQARRSSTAITPGANDTKGSSTPKIAVEYYGHLNLESPAMFSDLFFCQQSNIPRKDILVYFKHPTLPATDKTWQEIKKYGMSAIAINSNATVTPHIPVFNYRGRKVQIELSRNAVRDRNDLLIRKSLHRQIADYSKQYDYWVNFVTQNNIKMHVSWYKHGAGYFALADALQGTGGVAIIYQRSFESAPNPWTITATDVVFGFSKLGAHLGKDLNSTIPYYVVAGYFGDYRFAFARKQANDIRSRLQSHGARKILAYFDENSVDDPRWNIGHDITQENYSYLLNKVLETPWLGLILKPKVPATLRRKLGPAICELLDRAVQTNRCFIYEEGNIFGSHPPAMVAQAADVAIHGHLFAATAGVESALTGTTTLMLDREGYSASPLCKLGVGHVIFKSWDVLWHACQDHWNSPEGIPGFGDWSSMIDDIDPFRDGRAAQRMGTYLQWLLEGFKAKLPRETVLADAAERYSEIWGKDKIFSVNCNQEKQEFSLH